MFQKKNNAHTTHARKTPVPLQVRLINPMEIAPSSAPPSAAAAGSRKLPPVRCFVPYEVEEDPVFDPDSPRSPSEQRAEDSGGGGDQEKMHLECYNYKTASTWVRQSDKYAEMHYNGDPGNEIKYELVDRAPREQRWHHDRQRPHARPRQLHRQARRRRPRRTRGAAA
ncbi:hypothetical protein BRADI_1g30100v3 [Brachypodium distachyon]|uniref:Uncharacterized protein n=1 Tax=Brachypodium distachyon TaxID=15368 RepID=A0A0Q3L022_BRADI|nr:hypothetical protein BRADI_1g30100v3 [Brachypodium distachyon]